MRVNSRMRTATAQARHLLSNQAQAVGEKASPKLPPRARLYDFFRFYVWPILNPGSVLESNWHVELLCEELEYLFERGEAAQNLLINIAPRHLKSRIVSIAFPCWVWLQRPSASFLFLSYSGEMARTLNEDRRKVIRSASYQAASEGNCILSDSVNTKATFENVSGGTMAARGFDGSVTGIGANSYIVVDDPHNPVQVESKKVRERTVRRFADYSITRRDDPKRTKVIVVMQRTHSADVSNFCEKKGNYRVVKLETEATSNKVVEFPISRRKVERQKGDLLHPSRIGEGEVEEFKRLLGDYMWAARYQQNPVPEGGGLFKRWNWRFWVPAGSNLPPVELYDAEGIPFLSEPVHLPKAFHEQVQSWDMSFKTVETSDNVSGQVWGRLFADYFLLTENTGHLDVRQCCEGIAQYRKDYPIAGKVLVEGKANGPAVMQLLDGFISGIEDVEPLGGKEARAIAIQPVQQGGNMILPHPAISPWIWTWIDELEGFPTAAHDDRTDAATQAINYLREGEAGSVPESLRKSRAAQERAYELSRLNKTGRKEIF